MSADPANNVSPDVRAAIGSFLNEAQRDARRFALSDALEATRRVFPDLEISDSDLADAIASEALTAGHEIDYDVQKTPEAFKRKSLERSKNEGGALERKKLRKESRRRIVNDTVGTRRRAKETGDRNRLI